MRHHKYFLIFLLKILLKYTSLNNVNSTIYILFIHNFAARTSFFTYSKQHKHRSKIQFKYIYIYKNKTKKKYSNTTNIPKKIIEKETNTPMKNET